MDKSFAINNNKQDYIFYNKLKFVDIHAAWINHLPLTITSRIIYFIISYFILAFGIALSNRCGLPIIPTDLFPRELSNIIKVPYAKVKIIFDVTCLLTTAILTFVFLEHIKGLGIGTVLAAFTMGKAISFIGKLLDKKIEFIPYIPKQLYFVNFQTDESSLLILLIIHVSIYCFSF